MELFRRLCVGKKIRKRALGLRTEVYKGYMEPKVLIIDDDQELLSILQEVISLKFDCVGFNDGHAALDILRSGQRFDCIICDLMMPTLSGIQFYEELSKIDPKQMGQLVFLTGGSFTRETDEFLKRPGVVYCNKPVDTKILIELIQRTVAKKPKPPPAVA